MDGIKRSRLLQQLETASALDIHPTGLLLHPKYMESFVRDHGDMYNMAQKYYGMDIILTTKVKTWGFVIEPN